MGDTIILTFKLTQMRDTCKKISLSGKVSGFKHWFKNNSDIPSWKAIPLAALKLQLIDLHNNMLQIPAQLTFWGQGASMNSDTRRYINCRCFNLHKHKSAETQTVDSFAVKRSNIGFCFPAWQLRMWLVVFALYQRGHMDIWWYEHHLMHSKRMCLSKHASMYNNPVLRHCMHGNRKWSCWLTDIH